MEHNWSTGGSSYEAGGSSLSTQNPFSSTPYADVDGSSPSPYVGYSPYSYSPSASDFASYHSTFGFAPYHCSSSYTIDYSSFAPYTHGAYVSDSGICWHSIFFP